MLLDLTTVVSFRGVSHDGTGLVVAAGSGWGEFTLPAAHFPDLTSHYAVAITYENLPTGEYVAYLYSLLAPTQAGYDGADWWSLGSQDPGAASSGTATLYFGPGIEDFAYVVSESADRYVLFDIPEGIRVTAIDFGAVTLARTDWTQDADYEKVTASSAAWSLPSSEQARIPGGAIGHGELTETGPEYVLVPDGWVSIAHGQAMGNEGGLSTGTGQNAAGVRAYRGWTQGTIGQSNWTSGAYADHNWQPVPVGRTEFYNAPPQSSWPAGAIGIEWEGGDQNADWLDAWLDPTTTIVSNDEDDTVTADQPLAGGYRTDFLAAPGDGNWSISMAGAQVIGSVNAGGGTVGTWSRQLGQSWHLAPYLNAQGYGWVWTVNPTFVGSRDGGAEIEPSNASVDWQWGILYDRARIRWTYRPPRYRFIMADEVEQPTLLPAPPRRIFPRDDGRTGGARRVWPPSKSYQQGNRVDGSGYL